MRCVRCFRCVRLYVLTAREAREHDCAEIARLTRQLGYPASDDAMRIRLRRLLSSSHDAIFVAESEEGGLMGWIHGVLSQFLESDFRIEIASDSIGAEWGAIW